MAHTDNDGIEASPPAGGPHRRARRMPLAILRRVGLFVSVYVRTPINWTTAMYIDLHKAGNIASRTGNIDWLTTAMERDPTWWIQPPPSRKGWREFKPASRAERAAELAATRGNKAIVRMVCRDLVRKRVDGDRRVVDAFKRLEPKWHRAALRAASAYDTASLWCFAHLVHHTDPLDGPNMARRVREEALLLACSQSGDKATAMARALLRLEPGTLPASASTLNDCLTLAAEDNPDVVELLLQLPPRRGVWPGAKNNAALLAAAQVGQNRSVRALLRLGAGRGVDPHALGGRPLDRAVAGGHTLVVQTLMELTGASGPVEPSSRWGRDCIAAAAGGHDGTLQFIVEAAIARVTAARGATPTPSTAHLGDGGCLELQESLVDAVEQALVAAASVPLLRPGHARAVEYLVGDALPPEAAPRRVARDRALVQAAVACVHVEGARTGPVRSGTSPWRAVIVEALMDQVSSPALRAAFRSAALGRDPEVLSLLCARHEVTAALLRSAMVTAAADGAPLLPALVTATLARGGASETLTAAVIAAVQGRQFRATQYLLRLGPDAGVAASRLNGLPIAHLLHSLDPNDCEDFNTPVCTSAAGQLLELLYNLPGSRGVIIECEPALAARLKEPQILWDGVDRAAGEALVGQRVIVRSAGVTMGRRSIVARGTITGFNFGAGRHKVEHKTESVWLSLARAPAHVLPQVAVGEQ